MLDGVAQNSTWDYLVKVQMGSFYEVLEMHVSWNQYD